MTVMEPVLAIWERRSIACCGSIKPSMVESIDHKLLVTEDFLCEMMPFLKDDTTFGVAMSLSYLGRLHAPSHR